MKDCQFGVSPVKYSDSGVLVAAWVVWNCWEGGGVGGVSTDRMFTIFS